MMCSDVACPEAEALPVVVYYISYLQDGSVEVYFPESDADRKAS